MPHVEAVKRFGGARFKCRGSVSQLGWCKRRDRGGSRVSVEGSIDGGVSVVREARSAPIISPRLGVVRNVAVRATCWAQVSASAYDGGLPRASDVGVRGAAAESGGGGYPVAPTVAAGVPQGGESAGGSVLGQYEVFSQDA